MNVLGALRNSSHTGENRCVPCTVVNFVLLWIGVNVIAMLRRPIVAVAVFLVGVVTIWLRGYLVPYTPTFAPKIVASTPLPTTWFHDTSTEGSLSPETVDAETLITDLADAGVIAADEERLFLDSSFEDRWRDEMDRLASLPRSSLADSLNSLPTVDSATAFEDGGEWIATGGQTALIPRHVAVAELAAVRALEADVEDETARIAASKPLRQFLQDCPVCATGFERSTEVSCCGGHTNPRETPRETLVCPSCEQRFLTLPGADGTE